MSKRNIIISCFCLVLFIGLSIFCFSAFADTKSVSVSNGYLTLTPSMISSFEASSNLDMFNGSNSYGDYFSVFAPDPMNNLGEATFNLYGSDLALYPPNYSFNKVDVGFVCSASWTQVSDIFRDDNELKLTFGIVGYGEKNVIINQVSDLNRQPLAISLELSLVDFQEIGFGSRGFYINIEMPNHSKQVILYDPQISWDYGIYPINPTPTPAPTPTPTPRPPMFTDFPTLTFPPGSAPGDSDWNDFLPIDNDAASVVYFLFEAGLYQMPYLGGFIRLSLVLGLCITAFGLVIRGRK